MSQEVLATAEGLGRAFGSHWAVRGLDLAVARGEIVGLLGPNGAGKSTTLGLLTGTLAPTAGRVTVEGIELAEAPRRAKARVGFLPENPPLYRELTVGEYLRYSARLRGVAWRRTGTAVRTVLARCGLDGTERRLLGNLSQGYQKRVGLAQALIHAPALIVLDEPTTALDPIQIQAIRELISDLRGDHGVILSTHILPEVQHVCDRVVILAHGHQVHEERVADLAARRASALRVRFDGAVATAELGALPGVTAIEALADGSYRLRHGADADPAPNVARYAVEHGLALRELTPERDTLEQIFLRYAGGEPAVEAPA